MPYLFNIKTYLIDSLDSTHSIDRLKLNNLNLFILLIIGVFTVKIQSKVKVPIFVGNTIEKNNA